MHTEIKTLDLSQYMFGTIFMTMLISMSLFPRLKNRSNVSYCLINLALNYNAFAYIIIFSINYRKHIVEIWPMTCSYIMFLST